MTKAIYALSADPITLGHMNVIERAAKMFDEVIVGIGQNAKKNYLFPLAKREEIARKSLTSLMSKYDIKILSFEGALVDFAMENEATVVIRGLRDVNDFQSEQNLAGINKNLYKDLETCFILSEGEYYVSSSATKEIISNGFSADNYLTIPAKAELQKALKNQRFIGITGLMGSGKSYVASQLEQYSQNQNVKIWNLDLDELCNEVYDIENRTFEKQRRLIIEEFGSLNKKEIAEQIFSSSDKLKKINKIFKEVIEYQIRKKSKDKEGVILLNGATIIANNYLNLANNQMLFVNAKTKTRMVRCLEGRNIQPETISSRDSVMMEIEKQKEMLQKEIEKSGFGFSIDIDNEKRVNIKKIYDQLIEII